jgi:hypothetical protein
MIAWQELPDSSVDISMAGGLMICFGWHGQLFRPVNDFDFLLA